MREMRVLAGLLVLAGVLTAAGAVYAQGEPGPEIAARSGILMEKETGTVLWERDAHRPMEPASVTKVMTILLVMEALDTGALAWEDTVTVTAHAAGMGGSQVYLKEGERVPVEELLKCVVVSSANDGAVALAEHLAGSESAFVGRMNRRAEELGMKDTVFQNCTGLPAAGHLTTAGDIALMSRELVLHHPGIRRFTTLWTDTIREGTFGLTNTNRLIRFFPGATGLKTGFTARAGHCISATAERDGMELIAVVLDSPTGPQRFRDAAALLEYGFAGWTLVSARPDGPLPPVAVALGRKKWVQPVPKEECRILLPRGEEKTVTTSVTLPEDVEAPVEQGQVLGEMTVSAGGRVCRRVPLLAGEEIPRLGLLQLYLRLLARVVLAE